jgi:hypothetical protein
VKIGAGVVFCCGFGAFRRLLEASLVSFESASVRARPGERRPSVVNGPFGTLRLLFGAALQNPERLDAQTAAHTVDLAAREIVRPREPPFETRALRRCFVARSGFGRGATGPSRVQRRPFGRRLPFGVGELVGAPVDPIAPHADERLAGVALLHRSFLSGDTRG